MQHRSLTKTAVYLLAVATLGCARTTLREGYPMVETVEDVPVFDAHDAAVQDTPNLDVTGIDAIEIYDTGRFDVMGDIPTIADAVYCRSSGMNTGECHRLFQAMGIPSQERESAICCEGQCYRASACSPNGPAPARCDLNEYPCGPGETCCPSQVTFRRYCANRVTRAGCR